jgi:hypothetical protein
MDPFLERNPQWNVFHGWFIRKLAEQSIERAWELGCVVDVERSVYGRESTGELAQPDAVHEVSFASTEEETYKQEYIVVREEDWGPVLAVVEFLSFANKSGSYRTKYLEK